MSKRALITGTSTGFGSLIAHTLLSNGYDVVASMRDINGRNKSSAEQLKRSGATVVEIDVTNDSSVEKGVKESGNIDFLINNAGVSLLGLQESSTISDWQKIFDVNVFGVQRMNRAVLPQFRKKQKGLVVYISSILGRTVLPFMGPYNASKFALEGLAETYRAELSQLGIESSIIEPGAHGTNFLKNILSSSDSNCNKSYGDTAKAPAAMVGEFEKIFADPEFSPKPQMVANAVLEVINMAHGSRPFRTVVDGLGWFEPFTSLNNKSDSLTHDWIEKNGMGQLLQVKLDEQVTR